MFIFTKWKKFLLILVCLLVGYTTFESTAQTKTGSENKIFTYSKKEGVDETLWGIALYLIDRNRKEGDIYTSKEVEQGILGYRIRYFDNGNKIIDKGDWLSIRRYLIPEEPDTLRAKGYFKKSYLELMDIDLDGINERDYYFIEGRRFNLINQPFDVLQNYQSQIERGINVYIQKIGYQAILKTLESKGQSTRKRDQAYEDGSLPSQLVLGLDLPYVFRPKKIDITEKEFIKEIRQRIGFVFSATTTYTDFRGMKFRDISDQPALTQRTYDPIEKLTLTLILDVLFDTDADGIINLENIQNGYNRFRELHQQLSENARGLNRRIVLPNEKLVRLRKEYENLHNKPFKLQTVYN